MRLLTLCVCLGFIGACSADAPKTGDLEQDREDSQGTNEALRELTFSEQSRIMELVGEPLFEPVSVPEATFVLHDTAGATSAGYMRQQVAEGRGPLGAGPQLWLSKDGSSFLARPFYSRFRPSATVYEKAGDLLSESQLAHLGKRLWASASEETQIEALANVLAPLEATFPGEPHRMSASEIAAETSHAQELLEEVSGRLFTTALWTVQLLVEAGQDGLSEDEFAKLKDYFNTRDERISKSVNVELGQIAGNNCSAGGTLTPYSDQTYEELANLYLQTALVAGYFPETTTHFFIDAEHRGHCDPRCFDLGYFYSLVAERMGHPEGTLYGIPAIYGRTYGTHTVWWDNATCQGEPRGQ